MGRLLTLTKFTIRHLTAGVDAPRFDPFIVEAEEGDIRPFLGDALFLDFVNGLAASTQVSKYVDLLNGTTYTYGDDTIEFKGIGQALQYYAYARYLQEHDITHTKVGAAILQGEFAQRPAGTSIQRKIDSARSMAVVFMGDTKKFLLNNADTYPLYCAGAAPRKGGAVFKIVK